MLRRPEFRALYRALDLECSRDHQFVQVLAPGRTSLFAAGHVLAGAAKVGNLAKPVRAMLLQRGWLWPQAEAGRQVCPDLAQTVKARRPAVAHPVSVYLRATVCRQAYLVQMVKVSPLLETSPVVPLRPVTRDRVCLLELAKLAAQPRQEMLDSPRLLVTDHRARVPRLPLAAKRSSDFQS